MLNYYESTTDHPIFAEGDQVEFEVVMFNGSAIPRWDLHNNDNGRNTPDPIIGKGEVTLVAPDYIYVEYEVDGLIGKGNATFPYYAHKKYTTWQWNRSGYLKKCNVPRCVCGSETVYGKDTKLHSFWCEKNKKETTERK